MAMPAGTNLIAGWMAESNTDLDKPTGCTVTNPGTSTTNPTLSGSGDDTYADFDGSTDVIKFTPSTTPLFLPETGDFTIATKLYFPSTVNSNSDVIWILREPGASQFAEGGELCVGGVSAPDYFLDLRSPTQATFDISTSSAIPRDQVFDAVVRRSSGTTSFWVDGTDDTSQADSWDWDSGDSLIIGADEDGSGLFWEGRIYYVLFFDTAIADADISTTSNWTKTNIRSLYFGGGAAIIPQSYHHLRQLRQ